MTKPHGLRLFWYVQLMRFAVVVLVGGFACNLDSKLPDRSDAPLDDAPTPIPTLQQTAYLKASNTNASDLFGDSVAISADGQRIAVVACGEASNARGINQDQEDNSALEAGAAYVLRREGASWFQEAYLKASNTEAGDHFGCVGAGAYVPGIAISADGGTIVIGARDEDSASRSIDGDQSNNTAAGGGALYVFVRDNNTWRQQAYVKPSNLDAGDHFGSAVALSSDGNVLAAGAANESSNSTMNNMGDTDNSASTAGAAYVFRRTNGTWSQEAYVKAPNAAVGDAFGAALALSSDGFTLAVGAFSEDGGATTINGDIADNSKPNSGAVYTYRRSGSQWLFDAYVKASNSEANDNFGLNVALSADGATMVVGARGEAGANGGVNAEQTSNDAVGSGAAYVYVRDVNGWQQHAYLKAPNPGINDGFQVVAISHDGRTIAIGADDEDSGATGVGGDQVDESATDSGAVYLFRRNGTSWDEPIFIKPSNTDINDGFFHVALNADGSVLVVGAAGEASDAVGEGGDQSDDSASGAGAVYVFEVK